MKHLKDLFEDIRSEIYDLLDSTRWDEFIAVNTVVVGLAWFIVRAYVSISFVQLYVLLLIAELMLTWFSPLKAWRALVDLRRRAR